VLASTEIISAIEPFRDIGMALAEAGGRNANPDSDRKAPLRRDDHLSQLARHS